MFDRMPRSALLGTPGRGDDEEGMAAAVRRAMDDLLRSYDDRARALDAADNDEEPAKLRGACGRDPWSGPVRARPTARARATPWGRGLPGRALGRAVGRLLPRGRRRPADARHGSRVPRMVGGLGAGARPRQREDGRGEQGGLFHVSLHHAPAPAAAPPRRGREGPTLPPSTPPAVVPGLRPCPVTPTWHATEPGGCCTGLPR